MTIEILPDYRYSPLTTDLPVVGKQYILDDAADGSDRQNRAFHALVQEYWTSGMHSYTAKNFADFRDQIKRDLGAGFDKYYYVIMVDGKPRYRIVKTRKEVPAEILADPDMREMVCGRLKSWADYTKKERGESITRLVAEMIQVGVNSKKFDEILLGMAER
jgi:hypothetical protein